jgi:hypothetical protein
MEDVLVIAERTFSIGAAKARPGMKRAVLAMSMRFVYGPTSR